MKTDTAFQRVVEGCASPRPGRWTTWINDSIIDILKNADQPMFLVCVTDQVKRLGAPAEQPKRKTVTRETPAATRRSPAVGRNRSSFSLSR